MAETPLLQKSQDEGNYCCSLRGLLLVTMGRLQFVCWCCAKAMWQIGQPPGTLWLANQTNNSLLLGCWFDVFCGQPQLATVSQMTYDMPYVASVLNTYQENKITVTHQISMLFKQMMAATLLSTTNYLSVFVPFQTFKTHNVKYKSAANSNFRKQKASMTY